MNRTCSRRRSLGVVLLVVLVGCTPAYPQDIAFEAVVDKNPVALGDQLTLSFVLSNAGTGQGSDLQVPDLGAFHIMSGPNRSTSMQIVNSQMSSSVTYSYVLQPKDIGTFTIGTASIEAGGTTYRSTPLTVEVIWNTVEYISRFLWSSTVTLPNWHVLPRSFLSRSTIIESSALSFSLFISSDDIKASCSMFLPLGLVPFIGRVWTMPSPIFKNLSGDELTTW